jgi:glucosamine-6-phosphate deaminase
MDVRIESGPDEVADLAADFIEHALDRPNPTIGLAAGGSPVATYDELIRRHRERGVRFDHANYVLLDEYVGVGRDDPTSYHRYIRDVFTDHVGVPTASVHGPDGDQASIADAADRYERLLAELAPRALQLLGIGRDGHIGFNEPTSSLASRTRITALTATTRADNQRFFSGGEVVPSMAITMGIATILEAERLLLIATGEAKAAAIAAAIEGPVSAMVPASALQLHPDVIVIIDEAAATGLRLVEHYRDVAAHRPDWQRP